MPPWVRSCRLWVRVICCGSSYGCMRSWLRGGGEEREERRWRGDMRRGVEEHRERASRQAGRQAGSRCCARVGMRGARCMYVSKFWRGRYNAGVDGVGGGRWCAGSLSGGGAQVLSLSLSGGGREAAARSRQMSSRSRMHDEADGRAWQRSISSKDREGRGQRACARSSSEMSRFYTLHRADLAQLQNPPL